MKNYDAIIKTVLAAYPNTQTIYRFGSWGTPFQRADSDLDIAVLLPHESAVDVDGMNWVTLNGELAYAVRIDFVDLINLRMATTSVQAEILRTGEIVYSSDDDARVDFEATVLSMYQDLNIERMPLYQDIMATGRVLQP